MAGNELAAALQREKDAAVEAARAEGRQAAEDLDGAMFSVWLHGDWRWLTRNMTTEQREAAADAVDRYERRLNDDDDEPINPEWLRWWRY